MRALRRRELGMNFWLNDKLKLSPIAGLSWLTMPSGQMLGVPQD
jgi:hypothetical protein